MYNQTIEAVRLNIGIYDVFEALKKEWEGRAIDD